MNTKSNNILKAIEWIDSQLQQPTRKIEIDKYIIIHDLNYSLEINKKLLEQSEGANLRAAYNRTKLIKDFLTNEKAR